MKREAPGRRDPAESVAHARELRHNLKTLMVLKAVSCNGDHNPGEDVPLPVCGNEGREMRSGRNQASAVVRQGRDRVERHHERGRLGGARPRIDGQIKTTGVVHVSTSRKIDYTGS
jgi:hypothetical protein